MIRGKRGRGKTGKKFLENSGKRHPIVILRERSDRRISKFEILRFAQNDKKVLSAAYLFFFAFSPFPLFAQAGRP
jgi:hypothetical protein